jgi:hypothetical protein
MIDFRSKLPVILVDSHLNDDNIRNRDSTRRFKIIIFYFIINYNTCVARAPLLVVRKMIG